MKNITNISQTGNIVTIQYTDENGTLCRNIFVADDEKIGHITDFATGAITADELLDAVCEDTQYTKVDEIKNNINFRLERISNHLTTDGMHVYFDGADFGKIRLDTTLENHLVRMLTDRHNDNNIDWVSYVNFTERLYTNVDPEIRERIVEWLAAQSWLTFTEDGRLVGYRGTTVDENGTPCSVHEGPGIVNGEIVNGHVPNPVGAIVEIDRSLVVKDSATGCASGMHVGTYDYAVGWAHYDGYVLRVAVAPEDIISVPFDCSAQKIRCCRFEVLEATPANEVKEANDYYEDFHGTFTYGDGADAYDIAAAAYQGAGLYELVDENGDCIDEIEIADQIDLEDAILENDAAAAYLVYLNDDYDDEDEDDDDDEDDQNDNVNTTTNNANYHAGQRAYVTYRDAATGAINAAEMTIVSVYDDSIMFLNKEGVYIRKYNDEIINITV